MASDTPRTGRKPGRPRKISRMTVEEAEQAIAEQLPTLIERLMDLAKGVLVVEYTPKMVTDEAGVTATEITERVYRLPPDKDALKYLTERVLGRVPQRMEITGRDGGPMKVVPWMPEGIAVQKGLVTIVERPEQKQLTSGRDGTAQ